MTPPHDERAEARHWARRNAASAGIAAVLMIYFGFVTLARPDGEDLFSRSNLLLYYTLRLGGPVMAGVAAASLAGLPKALLCDAAASVIIGLLVILSGGGMLIDGGGTFQNAIIILFGMMFISGGARNAGLYKQIAARHLAEREHGSFTAPTAEPHDAAREANSTTDHRTCPRCGHAHPLLATFCRNCGFDSRQVTDAEQAARERDPQEHATPIRSLAGELKRRRVEQAEAPDESLAAPEPSRAEPPAEREPPSPPPGGYLASFGQKKSPPDTEGEP